LPTIHHAHNLYAVGHRNVEDDVAADGETAQVFAKSARARPANGISASISNIRSMRSINASAALTLSAAM
jgi:hypothetical protein